MHSIPARIQFVHFGFLSQRTLRFLHTTHERGFSPAPFVDAADAEDGEDLCTLLSKLWELGEWRTEKLSRDMMALLRSVPRWLNYSVLGIGDCILVYGRSERQSSSRRNEVVAIEPCSGPSTISRVR